jgi:hypothetical protein
MLKLQMLPAGCGDCLWLEYGTPPAMRIVIIDGGIRDTAEVLRQRIEAARRERGTDTLDVELLVVTHIDNDHILGIIELLSAAPSWLHVKDIWFNGWPQLKGLPPLSPRDGGDTRGKIRKARSGRPPDLMGGADDDAEEVGLFGDLTALVSPSDLLGRQQSDELSALLAKRTLPWNQNPCWNGKAVVLPASGDLPVVTLDGQLSLTLLGPTLARLYKLCTAWADVLGGVDELQASQSAGPADLLGGRNTWPPVWKDEEQRDPSDANGSSIMLLAEYDRHALLLAGDGHAPDLAAALETLCHARNVPSTPFPLTAFKLPHHGSEKNLTRAVLEKVNCSRYLISTDGSNHGHPDHQAMLRILSYSRNRPELMFNYLADTTRPWRDSKSDIIDAGFQDYDTRFPDNRSDGLILSLA